MQRFKQINSGLPLHVTFSVLTYPQTDHCTVSKLNNECLLNQTFKDFFPDRMFFPIYVARGLQINFINRLQCVLSAKFLSILNFSFAWLVDAIFKTSFLWQALLLAVCKHLQLESMLLLLILLKQRLILIWKCSLDRHPLNV